MITFTVKTILTPTLTPTCSLKTILNLTLATQNPNTNPHSFLPACPTTPACMCV